MRLPQLHLRTLLIAVALLGLVIGNYVFLDRQIYGLHSYGFPPPPWQVMLLSLVRVAISLLYIGLAYGAIRMGWQSLARLRSARDHQR
jgi:hypothetical protein